MKQLTLKTSQAETGEALTYEVFIRACLDHPPAKGFARADLKRRDRIEKVLDASNGLLELEDADAAALKQLVEAMRWGMRHPLVLEFCDDVEAL